MKPMAFAAASVEPFLHQNVADWWPHHIDQSAWLEHTPFAAWMIPRLKPSLMVELGTHRAVSYMAFCGRLVCLGSVLVKAYWYDYGLRFDPYQTCRCEIITMGSDRAKSRIEAVFKANTAYSAFDLKVSYFEIFEISASRKNG